MIKLHLKKPRSQNVRGGRKQFRIMEEHPDGKFSTLNEPRLDAINALLLSGTIDRIEAEAQVKRLVATIKSERGERIPIYNQGNYKVLDQFWKTYSLRDLIDPDTAYHDYRRAIEAIGDIPIASASLNELQKSLKPLPPNRQRRVVSRLNTILKFLKRDIQLRAVKPPPVDVSFLTPEEINKVCSYMNHLNPTGRAELNTLVQVLFHTGMRVGEVWALGPSSIRSDGTLWVASQIDKSGVRRQTKTRSERRAYVLPGGMDWVRTWIEMLASIKTERSALAHRFKRLCFKVLKGRKLCLHDLRHSYAIYLVGKGVPLDQVAQSLGNSVVVCQRHYTGFKLSDEGIRTIDRILIDAKDSN